MGIFLTLPTSSPIFLSCPPTLKTTPIHQDNYFPLYFYNLWKKINHKRDLESICSKHGVLKVRSDCSGNCSGEFWICNGGYSTTFLRLSCSLLRFSWTCCSFVFIWNFLLCKSPLLWLVTSWASTACFWQESVPGCSVFLQAVEDSWGLSLDFPFWLNKASFLSFSSQVTCLQPSGPRPLSLWFISVCFIRGPKLDTVLQMWPQKVPGKGNNHLSWPPGCTLDSAVKLPLVRITAISKARQSILRSVVNSVGKVLCSSSMGNYMPSFLENWPLTV